MMAVNHSEQRWERGQMIGRLQGRLSVVVGLMAVVAVDRKG